jgi:hypothetical protein
VLKRPCICVELNLHPVPLKAPVSKDEAMRICLIIDIHYQYTTPISVLNLISNYHYKKMDRGEIGWDGKNWIHLALDRNHCRVLVNTVINLTVL